MERTGHGLSRIVSLLLCVASLAVGVPAWAQEGELPVIRSKAREVVISAYVLRRITTLGLAESAGWDPNTGRGYAPSRVQYQKRDLDVAGLTAKDFRLYEDKVEQKIRSVRVQRQRVWTVFDNVASHRESANTPAGTWSGPDFGEFADVKSHPRQSMAHTYFISYVPPTSPEGSCHQISIKVNRPETTAYARRQYCNTEHSASDLLNGTETGRALDAFANSGDSGKIPVSVQVAPVFGSAQQDRVNIAIEFPWREIKSRLKDCFLDANVSLVGLIYKDGALVSRFSDMSDVDTTGVFFLRHSQDECKDLRKQGVWAADVPTRYVTQVDLSPGAYTLKVSITDGEKFGRVEVPVVIEPHDRERLDLSGMVLSRRLRLVPDAAKDEQDQALEYVPLISQGIQVTPSGDTQFAKGLPLLTYFEVLRPSLSGENGALSLRSKMVDAKTGQEVEHALLATTIWSRPGNPVVPIIQSWGIDKLPAGEYRLEVQAVDPSGQSTPWRTALFTVK